MPKTQKPVCPIQDSGVEHLIIAKEAWLRLSTHYRLSMGPGIAFVRIE